MTWPKKVLYDHLWRKCTISRTVLDVVCHIISHASRLVTTTLSRLKYLRNCWIDWRNILYIHGSWWTLVIPTSASSRKINRLDLIFLWNVASPQTWFLKRHCESQCCDAKAQSWQRLTLIPSQSKYGQILNLNVMLMTELYKKLPHTAAINREFSYRGQTSFSYQAVNILISAVNLAIFICRAKGINLFWELAWCVHSKWSLWNFCVGFFSGLEVTILVIPIFIYSHEQSKTFICPNISCKLANVRMLIP